MGGEEGDDDTAEVAPTALLEAFLAMHEMFLAALAAGFSEYQACTLLGSWMAANGHGGTTTDGG